MQCSFHRGFKFRWEDEVVFNSQHAEHSLHGACRTVVCPVNALVELTGGMREPKNGFYGNPFR